MIIYWRCPDELTWSFMAEHKGRVESDDGYTYEHQAEAVADRHLREMRDA